MFSMPGKETPKREVLDWMIPFQRAQDLHDQLYYREVACMSPTTRANHLVLVIAKYITHIQSVTLQADNGVVVGRRITDILIAVTSLLTAMNVSIAERLQKIGVPAHVSGENQLMQWLIENYVYQLTENQQASAKDVYDRGYQYVVAMPIHLYSCIDAVENLTLMESNNARSVLVNSAMHLWCQAVISHARHGHSFTKDISERLRELERGNIHHELYGLFPNYNVQAMIT
mgnify:CR=1 FL=1